MSQQPSQARIVIVGGGIIGCSTAYHLAKLGCPDVLLLERAKLTSGSTHHAAGLVGQLRTSAGITQLLGHSVALYRSIEAETGLATGWKMNGGLRLACTRERMIELERQATTAHSFGLDMHLLTPSEARELWPLMRIDDLVGAAFLPTDGQANPSDITLALAKGARMHGATLLEDCAVTGVEVRDGRAVAVTTGEGRIACEVVVNCCGQWARELGRLAGVNVPLVSIQHQYMITEPIAGVTADLPTLRDPDRLTYYKEEVGGLVMGGYEPDPLAWAVEGIPEGFHFTLLDSNWDQFEQLMAQALPRVPALEAAGVKQLLNGPESFTPDGNFILGEAPEVAGYFVGAGFNAFGIASGGGAGRALAEWILAGEPPYDLWPVDIRRFGRPHDEIDWVRARTHEMYAKHYTIAWPHEEHASSRPYRRSPLYDDLAAAGACFGEKLGWERPNWFAPGGVAPRDEYSFGRPNWFPHVGEEHRAVRERVGVFDQTSFAKYVMKGPDAERALSWICANDVTRDPGTVVYTQLLNSRGGIECDLTVARLDDDRYYIVTGTGFATHDFHWIRSHVQAGMAVDLTDVTEQYSVIAVFGPRSRELLCGLTDDDLRNDAFPYGSVREIRVADAPVTALRVTYVGELGWELHTPVEHAREVYRAVMTAGRAHGVAPCGYRAIESLRLEKGYRAWGTDLTPDHSPLHAGLGFAVKLGSNAPFLGREALDEQRRNGLARRLACFTTDDSDALLLGRETIYRNGERVGWLTSAGYGYTVDKSIGYGYVRNPAGVDRKFLQSGTYELEVANRRVPAAIHFGALHDPRNERIRA
ncbi:MAG: FAD-dependent oxidoreductase [Gammaproteobacteria bacterium]|nr:FAD-dependent oxidoreductase [Gammaproteobacteria bacterium]NIP89266.1 FAD-dependent oxidoreductase [Gammaproteobacteria bacterium]NIR24100.1 FAD-dependent oxidoreductase [Gammaproteobacteria bacterium]NIS05762.1 FAD-dependent oxidoreductase [Gammaproteobacteria bacterium]NIV48467.1 FAD-dependent oxidoreductase [Gammaproteobacteria bacterium]